MDYELNLTEDQKQRIDAAQTFEEKVRIINEALGIAHGGKELFEDELDAVSGGGNKWPKTKEEADHVISTLKFFINFGGPECGRVFLRAEGYPCIKLDVLSRGEGIDKLRDVFTPTSSTKLRRGKF